MDPQKSTQTESKADRFKRLATARVNAALKKISLIGNLASPSYEYSQEQAQKILDNLRQAVNEVESKFQKKLDRKSAGFSL